MSSRGLCHNTSRLGNRPAFSSNEGAIVKAKTMRAARAVKPKAPNGAIIYRGPSMLDGAPIVAIVVGLANDSSNRKTGGMLQSYILRADTHPVQAIHAGLDYSICGNCPARGDVAAGLGRTCYVEVGKGAASVYGAFTRGGYPVAASVADLGAGRLVRLGTYGDPAAVPVAIWDALVSRAVAYTGYTHQWQGAGAGLRHLCMASADSMADKVAADAAGWRTFRVINPGDAGPVRMAEALCPASAEAGKKLTCAECKACNGTGTGRRASIAIYAHGGSAVMANVRKRYATSVAV